MSPPNPAYRAAICVPKQAKGFPVRKKRFAGAKPRVDIMVAPERAGHQLEKRHWNHMVADPLSREVGTRDWCGWATRVDKIERNKFAGNIGRELLVFV
jgi:hypothetical protein